MNTLDGLLKKCRTVNWDGNGALPITEKVAENYRAVKQYIPIPDAQIELFATPSGHIQVESKDSDMYEDYEISEDNVHVLLEDKGKVMFERTYTVADFIDAYRGPVWVPM